MRCGCQSHYRFEVDQPSERWRADVTHWHLADDTGVEILNILDDRSRLNSGGDTRSITHARSVTPPTPANDCAVAPATKAQGVR